MNFLRSLPLAFLLTLLVLPGCKNEAPPPKKAEGGAVKVAVTNVRSRAVQRVVDSVGTMFPYDEAVISAEIEGRVEAVSSDLGDLVNAGQVLVKISDEEQRYVVAQTEAQMRSAMERLGLKDEKDRIKDIKETPDVRRAAADLLEAEQRYRRTRELTDQGIGPRSDLDQASARRQALQASYDATLNQTRNLIQEVERVRASLDLQRKKLRDTTVKAPFPAFIKERSVTAGAYVRPNAPLFTLVKINPIRLRIEVPERMAPWIKIGQTADVLVEAFEGRTFQGKVWRIAPTVDQTKRTFIVEALIDNPRNELKPGSYARARIVTDKIENIRLVPLRAVSYVLGTNKAFVVKTGAIDARDVKLGDRYERDVEILEGLEEGEQIAVSNLPRLDAGVKVQIVSPDETKAAK